ncbi:glycosyltransferase family 2 protein [Thioalkalivibrio sp. ALE11]|uniref:glycosyltransferase family 2 protein n=1 Tax=Thioalkalivibrio sp. ALE11 TaxID=1265494 RepID=UPI0018CA9BB5|nr:glycosyltransferase family 2 protein [Thioalkalivibrio sp. ALE11]
MAYHRSLGIDDIVTVSNDLTDGSGRLLEALESAGWVCWRDVSSEPLVQGSMEARAFAQLWAHPVVQASDWVIDLDLDEFLVLHRDGSVQELAERHADADLVVLNWRNFGSDGCGGPGESLCGSLGGGICVAGGAGYCHRTPGGAEFPVWLRLFSASALVPGAGCFGGVCGASRAPMAGPHVARPGRACGASGVCSNLGTAYGQGGGHQSRVGVFV